MFTGSTEDFVYFGDWFLALSSWVWVPGVTWLLFSSWLKQFAVPVVSPWVMRVGLSALSFSMSASEPAPRQNRHVFFPSVFYDITSHCTILAYITLNHIAVVNSVHQHPVINRGKERAFKKKCFVWMLRQHASTTSFICFLKSPFAPKTTTANLHMKTTWELCILYSTLLEHHVRERNLGNWV